MSRTGKYTFRDDGALAPAHEGVRDLVAQPQAGELARQQM